MPILSPVSMLDTDLYKLTMQQAVIEKFPRETVRYDFFNRGKTKFPIGFGYELTNVISYFCDQAILTEEEKSYLKTACPFLSDMYLDFLKGYKYNSDEVKISQVDGDLLITIMGPWYRTILWEVPLMAMISELYYILSDDKCLNDRETRLEHNIQKGNIFRDNGLYVADYGTRRRFSYSNHNEVVRDLASVSGEYFVGTSNIHFAKMHGIKPLGTQAHEWFMFHAAKYGYRRANEISLKNWTDVYHGALGTALSDTYTTDVFLRDFDSLYARQFDGTRQDSGDPISYLKKIVHHYMSLGIDPVNKIILFSDSLNCDKAIEIHNSVFEYGFGIKDRYGIGTYLTNDLEGITPLNMVIKMTGIQEDGISGFVPTVKLSDDIGKHTAIDLDEIKICKRQLGIE